MAIGSDDRIKRRRAAFRRQRADLAAHLEAIADDGRQVFEDFAEIAAGRALNRDRGHEQRQVVLADAEIEIAHRGFEIGAIGDLVGDDAELAADRIRHLARHHGDRDRHRVAGAQAAHDDVEARRGTARRISSAAARAGSAAPGRAARCRRTGRPAKPRADRRVRAGRRRTTTTAPIAMNVSSLPKPIVRPDCRISLLSASKRQPIVAAAGQAALAAQLDQDASRDRARPSAA